MKQVCFVMSIIFLNLLELSAQKKDSVSILEKLPVEVGTHVSNLSTPKKDSVSVRNLQGLTFGVGTIVNESGFTLAPNIGYFNEIKINKFSTLTLGGNLNGSFNNQYLHLTQIDQNGYSTGTTDQNKFGLQLSVLCEPRLYLNALNPNLTQKKTLLNSGWYVGIPIELITTNIFSTYKPLQLYLSAPITIGYRKAINEKLFIEGSCGYGIFTDFNSVIFTPNLKVKLAYTF